MAHNNLGNVLKNLDEYQEAIRSYEKAIKLIVIFASGLIKHMKAARPQPNPTDSESTHIGGIIEEGITQKVPIINIVPNIKPNIMARPDLIKRANIRSMI